MNYSYGIADGCYGLSMYGKRFNGHQNALSQALNDLKSMMTERLASKYTTNDKQPLILATLRDIEKA